MLKMISKEIFTFFKLNFFVYLDLWISCSSIPAGFVQASISKIQGLFKDYPNSFQGLKINENY